MTDPRQQLETCLRGRVCLIGLGNIDYGDDGFGVRLAESLIFAGVPDTMIGGTTLDRHIGLIADQNFDNVVFIDAVEFGGAPGSVVLLASGEIQNHCPQISTHKISIGLLAQWVENNAKTKAWLLGVQPECVRRKQGLTTTLEKTRNALFTLLVDVLLTDSARRTRPEPREAFVP